VPELNKNVNIEISARGMRTIKKNGVYATLLKAGLIKSRKPLKLIKKTA